MLLQHSRKIHLSWVLGFPCSPAWCERSLLVDVTSWDGLGLLLGTKWHTGTPQKSRNSLWWPKDPSESASARAFSPICDPFHTLPFSFVYLYCCCCFNWDIVALQYCVSLCCAMKWVSSLYMCDPALPSRHPLCYAAAPPRLFYMWRCTWRQSKSRNSKTVS